MKVVRKESPGDDSHGQALPDAPTGNLKQQALRGGAVKIVAQAIIFAAKIGSMIVLGRMLDPNDFGLVSMVTVVTGILGLVKDGGLSLATVQRATISNEQLSNLFWLNAAFGLALSLLCLAMAPLLTSFYHESRLLWVTLGIAPIFLLNGLGVQHNALLMRQMRFPTYAAIDVASVVLGAVAGIGMALLGFGYWSLVGMALVSPVVSTLGAWWAVRWVPSGPRRGTGFTSMVKLGGAVTLNSIIIYIAYNTDKLLLGRYWGAAALGNYGRAYAIVNIPTDGVNAALGSVALSALSRLQHDPPRMRAYFLKGYALTVALTVPATVACAVFPEEIVALLLGPKWPDAAALLRLLTPTILIFALINPLFWLIFSLGLMRRSLIMAVVIAVIVISAYSVGVQFGPGGVAAAFSTAMSLWLVPHLLWCLRGTNVSLPDLCRAAGKPILAGVAAGAVCLLFQHFAGAMQPIPRLFAGGFLLVGTYVIVLLWALGQMDFYKDLVRSIFGQQADPL
jgi:PST family polysaccharide transporter